MISYEFYVNSYMGTAIPEKEFDALAARAVEALRRMERIYRVEGTEVEHAMAVCAMAEVLRAWGKRRPGVKSESVGSASVQYEDGAGALPRELYRKASVYLDIYRGAC